MFKATALGRQPAVGERRTSGLRWKLISSSSETSVQEPLTHVGLPNGRREVGGRNVASS